MKKLLTFAVMAIFPVLGLAQKADTFDGEIMDKQCAQMQSHENMMKAEHAATAKECTLACVKNGDSFALLDPKTKKVYLIEDENKVKSYAGQHVRITGSYDDDTQVLHVKSVTPAN